MTPNTLLPYDLLHVLVSHDRGPLTFPFPMYLTFGFSVHYIDFSVR